MIQCYEIRNGALSALTGAGAPDEPGGMAALLGRAGWIDLISPTPEEEGAVEAALGHDIPTRDDMAEIESSSRIYAEDGALYLTASVLAFPDATRPELAPVTFILSGGRLVTVRYHQPRSFVTFVDRASRTDQGCRDGASILLALLETIIDRLADILEGAGRSQDVISARLFQADARGEGPVDLALVLSQIGKAEDLNAKVRDSLSTLDRLTGYLSLTAAGAKPASAGRDKMDRARIKTLQRDLRSLNDYGTQQNQKIVFLLDATLGKINIRQSDIIKIFSVVAFVFLPPTLIASGYGINFVHMPELGWWFGYPMSLGMMAVSALLPYLFFRRKGWL